MTAQASASQIKEFETLLETFGKLPKVKQKKTLMEVAGYSHYENVASNILAFFLDPNEEHGLGDILLKELLSHLDESASLDLSFADVQREVRTENGKRIDIVITGENFSICVENKIFHWLANDLEEYSSTMEQISIGKPYVFKTVLALNHISEEQLAGDFTSISYPQLWSRIRPLLKDGATPDKNRWLTFLNDFMDTTENFASQQEVQLSSDQFFTKNHDAIESMLKFREDFYNRLRQKSSELLERLTKGEIAATHCKLWQAYKKTCLVIDFKHPEEYQISIDLFVSPKGWKLLLFGRGTPSKLYLEQWLQKDSEDFAKHFAMPLQNEWSKYVAKEWRLDTSIDDIANELECIIEFVSKRLDNRE